MTAHNLFEVAKVICRPPASLDFFPFQPPKHRDDTVPTDGVSRVPGVWPPMGPRHVVGDDDLDAA